FALANSPQGFELWATQGEPTSTRRVKRLSSVPSNRAERTAFVHNGRLFFSFPSPMPVALGDMGGGMAEPGGYELWVTDGTEPGTQRLAMFPTGDVGEFTVFRDRLFFRGGGPEGQELWSSDGTAQGTQQVIDLNTGTTVIVAPCAPPLPNQRPNCPPP
ncbi:MAG: hypothetical protein HC857_17470, partial [Synechococcales cyanobacterium RU_4_20]|nr:hypothetical protein [Synechococcales cyanobacterium RU_4_20]